jgi:hypothetical protein
MMRSVLGHTRPRIALSRRASGPLVALILAASVTAAVAARISEPPPAMITSSFGEAPFALGSYCWQVSGGGRCVDRVSPDSRCDLSYVLVGGGELVRFRLGFDPSGVNVSLGQGTEELRPARELDWRVPSEFPAGALLSVQVRGASGSASYLARLTRVRPRSAASIEIRLVRAAEANWLRGRVLPRAGIARRVNVDLLARASKRHQFGRLKVVRTDVQGRFAIRVRPRETTAYRVRWACATSRSVVVLP